MYDIEKDLGNYKAASAYLEEHVEILDSMYSTEQYSELQQLINKYNIKIHIREEQIKEQHRLQLIIALFIFCCLLIILFYQYHINKRKRIQGSRAGIEQQPDRIQDLRNAGRECPSVHSKSAPELQPCPY